MLLIGQVGWRRAYLVIGLYGVICGILLLTLMKEPSRGRYEMTHGKEKSVKL